MPVPTVKKGKWSKERERTKSGKWRRKRTDADRPRNKHSLLKYALIFIGTLVLILIIVLFFYSQAGKLPFS